MGLLPGEISEACRPPSLAPGSCSCGRFGHLPASGGRGARPGWRQAAQHKIRLGALRPGGHPSLLLPKQASWFAAEAGAPVSRQRHHPVEAVGDAAVGRGAQVEGLQQDAKLPLRLRQGQPDRRNTSDTS